MSDENIELQQNSQKMQRDIDQLHSNYDNLSKEVSQLKINTTNIGGDLKQINKSIEIILLKLNKLSDEYEEIGSELAEEKPITHSMKKIFTNPLRNIAVGALSAVYSIADVTIEKASSLRENLEDIVAEAQYSNKKKKMPPVENS